MNSILSQITCHVFNHLFLFSWSQYINKKINFLTSLWFSIQLRLTSIVSIGWIKFNTCLPKEILFNVCERKEKYTPSQLFVNI